jgi:hypothetical protein
VQTTPSALPRKSGVSHVRSPAAFAVSARLGGGRPSIWAGTGLPGHTATPNRGGDGPAAVVTLYVRPCVNPVVVLHFVGTGHGQHAGHLL